jgi:hypothetical protein
LKAEVSRSFQLLNGSGAHLDGHCFALSRPNHVSALDAACHHDHALERVCPAGVCILHLADRVSISVSGVLQIRQFRSEPSGNWAEAMFPAQRLPQRGSPLNRLVYVFQRVAEVPCAHDGFPARHRLPFQRGLGLFDVIKKCYGSLEVVYERIEIAEKQVD